MKKQGWITHCKVAFITEAQTRHYQRKNKRIDLVLHEMSIDSGLPVSLLSKWWAENKYKIEVPLCKVCNKNTVKLYRGKPLTKKSKYYGLCSTCKSVADGNKGGGGS
jgi:hypothetical protein